MKKLWFYWVLAILLTIGTAYYQRMTGPTYPRRVTVDFNDNTYKLQLLTTFGGTDDASIKLSIPDKNVGGKIYYRKYPTDDPWTNISFKREGEELTAELPNQPPAGKLIYYVELINENGSQMVTRDNPVIIRFKGDVPVGVIIPHVLLIFAAMLISNLAGILVIAKHEKFKFYGFLAFAFLLVGGMIMGPIMQKYAFGEFWTGIPFGFDLTDNKTLIAFVVWVIAIALNLKKNRPVAILIAAIVLLVIFSIPHSMMGSELDHTTGVVKTG